MVVQEVLRLYTDTILTLQVISRIIIKPIYDLDILH
jgi:hypothetical protein